MSDAMISSLIIFFTFQKGAKKHLFIGQKYADNFK